MSNTYAKQILRSFKSEAAQPSTSYFVADSPTTEEPKTSKPSSSKNRSTTLKPRTKQSHQRKNPGKIIFPCKDDDDKKTLEAVGNRLRRQRNHRNSTITEEKNSKFSNENVQLHLVA